MFCTSKIISFVEIYLRSDIIISQLIEILSFYINSPNVPAYINTCPVLQYPTNYHGEKFSGITIFCLSFCHFIFYHMSSAKTYFLNFYITIYHYFYLK